MDINRFTEKSREALSTAQGLAAQYGHQEVDAEHLALALVGQEDGFVPRVLERAGVSPKALITALEAALRKRPSVRGPGAEMGTIAISQRVAKALANAEALAKRLRDEYGCLAVEMESFALFHNAAVTGRRAACLLTISDSFVSHEETTAEQRQTTFTNMMEIALGSVLE